MSESFRIDFVRESNRIEGIERAPTYAEIDEFERFLRLPRITIQALQQFVAVYQPGARLRDKPGLNVQVGNHVPLAGGAQIRNELNALLDTIGQRSPHENHMLYETLHPFTDGNGRSGRALWAWQMKEFPLGFLHHFYYQTLQAR